MACAQGGKPGAAQVATDISVIAVAVIISIILVVVASVTLIIKLLRGVVEKAERVSPTFECASWLRLRQQKYLHGDPATSPSTGRPYAACDAAKQAIADSQDPKLSAPCPARRQPPELYRQSPYIFYMAAQNCPTA
jgi:hypothetical protein